MEISAHAIRDHRGAKTDQKAKSARYVASQGLMFVVIGDDGP